MKVLKSKKYLGSLLAVVSACVILNGCGKTDDEVKEPVVIETVSENQNEVTNEVVNETTNETTNENVASDIPNIGFYDGESLIEALDSIGYDSSLESRKVLAERLAISNYEGTAEQNKTMLAILKYQANEYRKFVEQSITTSEWVSYDDNYEIKRNEEGNIEYRKHNYTSYVTVIGTDHDKRSCRACGHEQFRTYTNNTPVVEWTAVDDKYETDGTNVREHTYGSYISVIGTEDQEKRTCSTCGHQQFRTVGHTQKQ